MNRLSEAPVRTGRANGLDTLRATAITLVFMYHYMVLVRREPTFGRASTVGWVGVKRAQRLYRLIEPPFMAIRDQRFPGNFPDARQPGSSAIARNTA